MGHDQREKRLLGRLLVAETGEAGLVGPGQQSPNIRAGQRRPRGRKVRRGRQEEHRANARAGGVTKTRTGGCQSSSHGLVSPGKAATVDRAADHVGWESGQRWVGGVKGSMCGNRGSAGSTGGLEGRRWQEGGHRVRGASATAQAQSEGSSLRSWGCGSLSLTRRREGDPGLALRPYPTPGLAPSALRGAGTLTVGPPGGSAPRGDLGRSRDACPRGLGKEIPGR